MRGTGARTGANSSGSGCAKGMRNSKKTKQQQQVVQWKQRNVQEGIVIVDEIQLSKLIKRDPIQTFYELDPEPFATGQFASVSRCRSRDTGQQFAAKFSSRARYGEDCSAEIHHEIALLSLCSPSSRVIRLHDVFETPTEIILVLEFAPGGDLQTIIDDNLVPFEADVVKFVRQLVEGLVYLHERKVAHLDIKPQNLVMMADFPDCDVKLCDFEISRVILEGIEIREILGTPDYVAPEILHYEPITLKADMWSLGVTTYVLLTGFSPFGGETDQETFCNISRAEVDFPEELFEDVSEEARDFIRCLLVRDPGARPSAKECLRHKWLSKKIPRTSTPPSLLRQDSSLVATKATTRAASPSEDSTRMSQRNATQQQKNLRKYLSKSREALFERVVQQQQQHQKNNLRKTTLLSQYHKTRRLCESQMSLVSKSRERLLMMDHQMSPHISRSREKLYGLRSLSKSHEVLDLCKSAAATGGQAPHGVGLGILKTLTRATTADLSMIPLLRQRLMGHGSSTTSISSSVTTEHDTEETSVPLPPSEHVKFSRMCSVPVSAITSPITPSPLHELLENSSQSPNSATKSQIIPTPTEDNLREKNMEHITQIPALLSPKLLKETIKNQSKFEMFSSSPLPVCEANLIPHEEQNEFKTHDETASLKTQTGDTCTWEKNEARTDAFDGTEIDCTSSYQDDGPGEDIKSEEEPKLKYEDAGKHTDLPQEMALNQQDIPNTSESTTETRAENKNEASVCIKNCEDVTEEDSEPRYTVAQLVSAFNRHQEVVTKTSLEVTMTTSDKGTKIPPMIFNTGNSAFPTGPNALRLFIPDIHITNEQPKRKQKRKYNLGLRFPNSTELNTEKEASKETTELSKDTYQTEDDESFQSLESSSSLATSDYDSITNFSMPEVPVDKEQNENSKDKTTTTEKEEARTPVPYFDENADSTNNNKHHDDSSFICTLVVEPPSDDKVLNTEPGESQHNVNINKFRLAAEVTPNYLRSGSLSSDTSGSSSMSWEELTPPCSATPTGNKNEAQQWPQKQTIPLSSGRQASRSRSPSVNREPWGRICTGTYNRALEKINSKLNKHENSAVADPNRRPNRKSLTLLTPPEVISASEKFRRKSIPVIKQLS